MRRTTLTIAAIAALTAFGLCATAQTPGGARGAGRQAHGQFRGRNLSLVNVPVKTLDALVQLTTEQKTRIEAIQTQYQSDLRALRPAKGQPADPGAREKRTQLTAKANEDLNAVLTPEQRDRLKAAVKDLAPAMAIGIPPALAIDLKLTADQKAKIAEIAKDVRAELKGADPATRRAKIAEAREKAMQLLTDEQKKIVEKFEAERQRTGRRGKTPKK